MSFSINRINLKPVKKNLSLSNTPSISNTTSVFQNPNSVNITTLTLNSVTITASGHDINRLNTTTGVAEASKALILDSNRNISNINSIECNDLYINNQQITGAYTSIGQSNSPFLQNIENGEASYKKTAILNTNKDLNNINMISTNRLQLNNNNVDIQNTIDSKSLIGLYNPYPINNSFNNEIRSIVYVQNLNLYVLCTSISIYTSTNLDNWVLRYNNTNNTANFTSIAYSPTLNLFVIVGLSNQSASYISMMTSSDAITWTPITFGIQSSYGNTYFEFYGIDWSPTLSIFSCFSSHFVSGTSLTYRVILSSGNGINWSIQDNLGSIATRTNQPIVDNYKWNSIRSRFEIFVNYLNASISGFIGFFNGLTTSHTILNSNPSVTNVFYISEFNTYYGILLNSSTSEFTNFVFSTDGISFTSLPHTSNNFQFRNNITVFNWNPDIKKFYIVISSSNFIGFKCFISSNLINWEIVSNTQSFNSFGRIFNNIRYNNNLLYLSTIPNKLFSYNLYPYNDINFNKCIQITNNFTNSITSICRSDSLNLFVAITNSNSIQKIMTSPDGMSWIFRNVDIDNNWTSICRSENLNLFVAVANSGSGNRVMTSPDGITWTSRTSASDNDWSSVCWSPVLNLFVAVATSGIGNRIMTSSDGINWTSRTSIADNNWCYVMEYSDSNYNYGVIAIANNITGSSSSKLMYSSDGITWTNKYSALDSIQSITYNSYNNKLLILRKNISPSSTNLIIEITNIHSLNPTYTTLFTFTSSLNFNIFKYIDKIQKYILIPTNSNVIYTSESYNCSANFTMSYLPIKSEWSDLAWSNSLDYFILGSTNNTNSHIIKSPVLTYKNKSNNLVPYSKIANLLTNMSLSNKVTNSPLINNFVWNNKIKLLNTIQATYFENNIWKTKNSLVSGSLCYSESLDMYISGLTTPTLSGSIVNGASYSYDGLTFTTTNIPFTGINYGSWNIGYWCKELNIFILGNANTNGTYKLLYSIDGITWNLGYTGSTEIIRKIIYVPSLQVLLAFTNINILYSYNGINWVILISNYTGALNFINIEYSIETDIIVGLTTSTAIYYSTLSNIIRNNLEFTLITPSTALNRIDWIPELQLFIGLPLSTTNLLYSNNCIIWRSVSCFNTSMTGISSYYSNYYDTLFIANTNGDLYTCNFNINKPDLSYLNSNSITNYSNDPINSWFLSTSPNNNNITSIVYSGDLTLIVAITNSGSGNRVITSEDGINWTVRTSASDNNWTSICWSSDLELFVAVANTGSGNRVMTSPNGINWTSRTSASDNNWTSVCWSSELRLFVAVANTGSGNRVMTSPNGINWTSRTSASNNNWTSVCWSSIGLFVAVSNSGLGNRIMTSPDGINWTSRTSTSDNNWTSVCWANKLNLFVAVASTGTNRIMTSTNGIDWTARLAPANNSWSSITWAYELSLLIAVSSNGVNNIMTSNDGITWNSKSSNSYAWNTICWASNLGIFISAGSNNIQISNIGIIGTQNSIINYGFNTLSKTTNTRVNNLRFGNSTDNTSSLTIKTSGTQALRLTNNKSLTNNIDLYYDNTTLNINANGTTPIINIANHNTINTGLSIENTLLTISASDINKLSVTHGIASANKALILDSSRNITNINTLSANSIIINNSPLLTESDNNNTKLQNITHGIGSPSKILITDPNSNIENINSLESSQLTINNQDIYTNGTRDLQLDKILTNGRVVNQYPNGLYARGIAYSPSLSLYVAVGRSWTNISNDIAKDNIMISYDAINWKTVVIPYITTHLDLVDIVWANEIGVFISISASGYVFYSTNGTIWSIYSPPNLNNWSSICWSPNLSLFVAVSTNGTGTRVMTSPDGITWTTRTSAADNQWTSVCWSTELLLFVAVAGTGTGNRVMTSSNGINWTIRTSSTDNYWTSVCWSPTLSLFVAVSDNGTGNRVMTSPNGINWTTRTSAADNQWTSVIWNNTLNKFIAVARSGTANRMMVSSNGTSWSSINTTGVDINYYDIIYANNQYVAVGNSSSNPYQYNNIAISSNEINWTLIDTNYDGIISLIWVAELNTYIGINQYASSNSYQKPIVMSPDGINWTYYATNIFRTASSGFSNIIWVPLFSKLFLSDISGNIYSSSDGLTWTTLNVPTPKLSGNVYMEYSTSLNMLIACSFTGGNGNSRIIYTTNGTTWQYVSSHPNLSGSIRGISWSPELSIFAIVYFSTYGQQIITSSDGLIWNVQNTDPSSGVLYNIKWISQFNQFIALGSQSMLTSSDGITWNKFSMSGRTAMNSVGIMQHWISELNILVILLQSTSSISMPILYYSSDGITWNSKYVSYNNNNNYGCISYSSTLKQIIIANSLARASGYTFITYNLEETIVSTKNNISKLINNNKISLNNINTSLNTWHIPNNTFNSNITSICYSEYLKLFVAVANSGLISERVVTSADGITWTARSATTTNNWTSVCWSSYVRLFVAIANTGTNNRVMTSSDGITWTSRITPADNNWSSICWSPELLQFVAVASSGTNNRIMTSPDGIVWSILPVSYNNEMTSICWSPELGLYVAVASSGIGNRILTSNDSITWIARTSPADNNWTSVCWSPELNLFVAVASSGTNNRVMTSSDGINWIARTSAANNNWTSVCWSRQLQTFVAVANSGTGNRIMSSNDGINWVIRTSIVDNDWTSICWSSDYSMFVAVSNTGTNNRIIRSNMILPATYNTIKAFPSNIIVNQQTGNVGLGIQNPSYLLELSLSAMKPSTNTWTVSSDIRLKENIEIANFDECYNNIKQIPLKYYKWKDDIYSIDELNDRHKIGWIAQDVESIIPNAVKEINKFNYNDCKSLNIDQIIANMHGAMYKLIQLENEQKNKINSLKLDIERINKFINDNLINI